FGEAFFDFQGRLQRQLLGTFVFSNPERVKQLNAIVHPHLLQAMRARIDEAQKNNPPMILVDAALIYEADIADTFDKVIVVTADEKIRMTRIMTRDQIQSEDAMLRIRAQMPIEEKERRADYVLTNNTSLVDLNRKVEVLFDTLVNNNKR
ncbi:MAG TPA: dephospho-CoA kinase, partial [bacterium]|nr:dephospho-CoA kinase [bacterium]